MLIYVYRKFETANYYDDNHEDPDDGDERAGEGNARAGEGEEVADESDEGAGEGDECAGEGDEGAVFDKFGMKIEMMNSEGEVTTIVVMIMILLMMAWREKVHETNYNYLKPKNIVQDAFPAILPNPVLRTNYSHLKRQTSSQRLVS